MTLLFLVALLLVVGVVVGVAVGRLSGGLAPGVTTVPAAALPDEPLQPRDVDDLRFQTVLRGYRMEQVDTAFDRVRDELVMQAHARSALQAQLDATLAELSLLRRQLQAGSEG